MILRLIHNVSLLITAAIVDELIDAEERRYQEFLKSDLPPALKERIADQIDEYMQPKAAKAKGRKSRG